MTKIPPFGCDVRKASDEERREFLRLMNKYCGKEEFFGLRQFYGVDFNGIAKGVKEVFAENHFKQIIPISEGIAILKQALGEEEKVEYEIHPIHLTNGKMATFHIPKNATEADIMLLISKLENIVSNTIGKTKP